VDEKAFSVELTLRQGYQFETEFELPGVPGLWVDEPAPLGQGAGPNAARLLAAAVGNCLSASYLFCMRRARLDVKELKTTVAGTFTRNAQGRLRIGKLKVRMEPQLEAGPRERIGRCLKLFEDFCIVTQSVRDGIDVQVEVAPVDAGVAEMQVT